MKKLTTVILMGMLCGAVWGQTQVPISDTNSPIWHKDGNVGIDKNSPEYKLDVFGSARVSGYFFGQRLYLGMNRDSKFQISYDQGGFALTETHKGTRLFIKDGGNIGIGTTSPQSRLDVNGSSLLRGNLTISPKMNSHPEGYVQMVLGVTDQGHLKLIHDFDNRDVRFQTDSNWGGQYDKFTFWLRDASGTKERMRITNDGNVGIGTTTPDAKLDVAGNIKAQEIEVTLASIDNMNLNGTLAANQITVTTNGQTADFVFEEDYNLRDLQEVESFIQTNKHLPDIPSAAAMEENGVNLAEMNKLLLQKIEELTLYAIEIEKARSAESEVREKLETEVKEMKEAQSIEVDTRKALEERLAKIETLLIEK